MTLDRAAVKEFCRISGDDQDATIDLSLDAAKKEVAAYVRRDLDAEYPDGWPEPCQLAVMYLVSQVFDDRTAKDDGADAMLPPIARRLLADYRDFS